MNEAKKLNATVVDYVCYYTCLIISIIAGFTMMVTELALATVAIRANQLVQVPEINKLFFTMSIFCTMLANVGVVCSCVHAIDRIYTEISFKPDQTALGTTGVFCGLLATPIVILVTGVTYSKEIRMLIIGLQLRSFFGWSLAVLVGINLIFALVIKLIKQHYERRGFCFEDSKDEKTKKRISRSPR